MAVAALGIAAPSLGVLLLAGAAIAGFFLFAGVAGFYATLAISMAPEARATGSGFVIGVGRVSSAVGPLAAGWLFAAGLGRGEVSAAFAACAVLAGRVLSFQRAAEARA